jgi:hypothetical protein
MKLPRRRFLHLAAGAAVLPAVSHPARAQTYPTHPVRIIVPFAPGLRSRSASAQSEPGAEVAPFREGTRLYAIRWMRLNVWMGAAPALFVPHLPLGL